MKNRICALLFIFFSFSAHVFALGKPQADDGDAKKLDNEWTLCVTNFDTKSLPESKLSVAGVITKKVVERLNDISYRTRVSPEYAYYEGYALYKSRLSAAKSLSAKREERSLLVFNGDADWKYRQNLAKVDAEIEKLTAAFEETEKNIPLINNEPVFKLTEGNVKAVYPEPPKKGNEYKFCKDQKADAFLSGTVIDFHGRDSISIKLYVVYSENVVYEDSVIFSPDDLDNVLDEITSRLIMTLSGSRPSAIMVKAEPADALVLINRSFAGHGDTGIIEYPPGKYIITASADEHESINVETELAGGEIAEINIKLLKYEFANVEIPGTADGIVVYQGAMYIGEAPLTLRLPVNILEYVELDTSDKLKGTAVFNTPEEIGSTYSISVKTGKPPVKGDVEKARTLYYWSWGGMWVTGLAAWISYHTFSSSDYAIRYNYSQTGDYNRQYANENLRMYYVSLGTNIALGAVSAFWVFNIVRYLYLANRGATPIVKTGKSK